MKRLHPAFGGGQPEGLRAPRRDPREISRSGPSDNRPAAARLAAAYRNLADLRSIARSERTHLEGVRERIGGAPVAFVPFLDRDVYDFDALAEVGRLLFSG